MLRLVVALSVLPAALAAQTVASSYATRDGRAASVVITCPNQDGSYTAGACQFGKTGAVAYNGPAAAAIVTANTAVTMFPAGSVLTGCDIINTGSLPLYVDFTATAMIGAATSIPLQPGQSYHCAFPPTGAVSAVAAQPQNFVAIRY